MKIEFIDDKTFVNDVEYPVKFECDDEIIYSNDKPTYSFTDAYEGLKQSGYDTLEEAQTAFKEEISISLETAKECLYHFSRKDLSQACIDELNEIWLDEQSVLELSSRLEESNPIDE